MFGNVFRTILLFLVCSRFFLACCQRPGGFAKCFAFCKTLRCTKSLEGLGTAKPPGRCNGSPKGFRYIVLRICVRAGLLPGIVLLETLISRIRNLSTEDVFPPGA